MSQKAGNGEKKQYRKLRVKLKAREKQKIKELLSKGRDSVRVLKRARILQILDGGKSAEKAAEAVGTAAETARNVGWRYLENGFSRSLRDAPRPGKAPAINDRQEQRLIAMVCGPSPQGHARWTVQLITEEAIKRKIVPKVSREAIRVRLKSHRLKPWREKNVVHSRIDQRVC